LENRVLLALQFKEEKEFVPVTVEEIFESVNNTIGKEVMSGDKEMGLDTLITFNGAAHNSFTILNITRESRIDGMKMNKKIVCQEVIRGSEKMLLVIIIYFYCVIIKISINRLSLDISIARICLRVV
jgi:hypothetical protein